MTEEYSWAPVEPPRLTAQRYTLLHTCTMLLGRLPNSTLQLTTQCSKLHTVAHMHIAHRTMHTAQFSLVGFQLVHCSSLHNAQFLPGCTLLTARCTMHNEQCTMHNAKCTIYNAHCTMLIGLHLVSTCTLHTAYSCDCSMYVATMLMSFQLARCTMLNAHYHTLLSVNS